MKHHPTCNPNYPEKPEGDWPQSTTDVPFGNHKAARTCNDCGAFEIINYDQELYDVETGTSNGSSLGD